MYTKSYNIPVESEIPEDLDANFEFLEEYQNLQTFQDHDGYTFSSNSPLISESFYEGSREGLITEDERGFITYMEEGVNRTQKLFLEFYETPRYLDDPHSFMRRYRPLLRDLEDIQIKLDHDVQLCTVKVTPNRVYTSLEDDYDSAPNPFTELALIQDTTYIYERLGETLYVSKDKLLMLKEGFYSIYPRMFFEKTQNEFREDLLIINSEDFTNVTSNYLFHSEGWITNDLFINPGKTREVNVTTECKNPLKSKDQLKSTREYILYKAEKDLIKPYIVLSSRGDEPLDEVKNLMSSHEEFMRPYFFLSDKILVSVNSEEVELAVKDFNKAKQEALDEGVPVFNFNF